MDPIYVYVGTSCIYWSPCADRPATRRNQRRLRELAHVIRGNRAYVTEPL